jgi:cytochrome c553/mono/diheme cytochrome c family protein
VDWIRLWSRGLVWMRQLGIPLANHLSTSPVVAVGFDGRGNVLAQTLEPARLFFMPAGSGLLGGASPSGPWASVSLSTTSRHSSGSDIFHTQAGGMIACASCHPEGGDDGHLWMLDGLPRRTPSLRATIAGTAPYHWPGDELDMTMLIGDAYTRRMSGAMLSDAEQMALTTWVEAIPAPPPPSWVDTSAAQRGRALFEGPAGCSACHSGSKFTNNATVDVGTGRDVGATADAGAPPTAFQVPPLVGVGWRTPLFHDGCADTMEDRFGKCSTQGHGSTAQLSSQDVKDLTAYLESL